MEEHVKTIEGLVKELLKTPETPWRQVALGGLQTALVNLAAHAEVLKGETVKVVKK